MSNIRICECKQAENAGQTHLNFINPPKADDMIIENTIYKIVKIPSGNVIKLSRHPTLGKISNILCSLNLGDVSLLRHDVLRFDDHTQCKSNLNFET